MSREAMQLALELIEPIAHNSTDDPRGKAYEAITALRQALVDDDDTSQERVDETVKCKHEPVAEIQAEDMGKPFNAIRVTVHFYAEVPAVGTKLYKAPPKKEWVVLTDEQIDALLPEADGTTEEVKRKVEYRPGLWADEVGIDDAWSKSLVIEIIRAVEKHHGIGGKA